MRLYPAIDIKEGRCVRLRQGQFDQVRVYGDFPADMARQWEKKGASYLHLVDLDGARKGRSVNARCIREIVEAVRIPVQLGGGIRSLSDVEEVLNLGVSRAIIGTKAVEDPDFVREAVSRFGAERIVVGIDAKNGMVAVQGWEEISGMTAMELLMRMRDKGVLTVIYTDISRDGMLDGPNIKATKALGDVSGLEIIASGGVSCMEDLRRIREAGIHGAIIGKALYEKKIDLAEAVRELEREEAGRAEGKARSTGGTDHGENI